MTTRCPYCRVELDENGAVANSDNPHKDDCANRPLVQAEIDRMFGQRKRKAVIYTERGREVIDAPLVSAAHHLDVVLTDNEFREPIALLLEELATLADLCSASKAAQTDTEGGKSSSEGGPSLKPAYAAKKRDQMARRINEEAESLAGWNLRPNDPYQRPGACIDCGGLLRREAHHCTDCGAPTLHAFKRSESNGMGELREG